jgi:hypothetical protein
MTSIPVLIAAILLFIIGTVHSWLGERRLIGPLLATGHRQGLLKKSAFACQVLRFAWHLTTVAWWGIGAMLLVLSWAPLEPTGRLILWITAATFLVTGLATLLTSRGRHLAWPVFLAVAGLTITPMLK